MLPEERTITDLASGASRTTRYTYNSQGLLETVDGPREEVSDITTYHYDTDGRLSRVTNALGHVTDILARVKTWGTQHSQPNGNYSPHL